MKYHNLWEIIFMNNIMNISEVNNSLNNLNYYINAINDNLNEISTLIEKL